MKVIGNCVCFCLVGMNLLTAGQDISTRVKKEIDRQLDVKLRHHAKKEVYGGEGRPDLLYKVPKWPIQARYFLKKDMLGVDINAFFATQAYSSSGATQDLSNLVFKEGSIRLKDILLASKLIDIGVAEPTTTKYNFLDILKDQVFSFDASTNSQELAFSYVRHFLGGDIALGASVPLVRKVHKVELTSCLTPRLNERLASESPGFFTTYPDGLPDLLKDILSKKDICLNKRDTEVGLGDITLFCNYEIPWKHCDRFLVGLRALIPSSRRLDVYKLWDPELGNGGFAELSLFSAMLFNQSRWFNPHVFGQLTYAFSSTTFRRVPKEVSKSDIENISNAKIKFGEDFMLYGNGVRYVASEPDFCELDATVKYFADGARKTKIDRGGNLFVRVGNIIEHVFTERLFFDMFYDFYAKARDYLGFRKQDCAYDASLLARNTSEIAHRIGVNLNWQADDSWRVFFGGFYTFAGKNTQRLFEIDAAVTLQF